MASSFEVMDRSHSKVLLHELDEQRLQGTFCDVIIVVGDSKFKAHKNVLAAFSLYFKELLASQNYWVMDQVLELREIKAEVFAKILNFIYSSRVVIEKLEEANELATAGHRLGIHFLEELVEVSSQTRICNERSICSSAQSSLSDSSDQGTKEGNHDCTGSKGLEDPIRPLGSWPTDSFFNSRASVGPFFPIDLTASTSRQSGDAERPPSAYRSQNLPGQPGDTGTHPPERSQATSAEREEDGTPLSQEGNEPGDDGNSQPSSPFHGAFARGASRDLQGEANEEAKRLYTLSTVAFQGLGFSVEEAANPSNPSALPMKEQAATALSAPNGVWGSASPAGTAETAPSVHARLHRAGRALSCRHCDKAFIHVKRLHTHQTLCRERAERPPSSDGRHHHHHHHRHHRHHHPADRRDPGQAGGEQISDGEPSRLALAGDGEQGRRPRSLPRLEVPTDDEHFMKVVDGHLLYFCAICERSYMTLSSLKRHANVHSWRRKYPCRYCDKVFALAEYRTKHEVWHTGERRYQCIFCWETFVTYYNLKTHQKSFHGVDPGLTTSQKTPNGGYKPKLNAFKLYRLLPMRSQKRPYKTYSHSVPGNMLKYTQSLPISLAAGASPEPNLAALSPASPAKYVQDAEEPACPLRAEKEDLPSDQGSLRRPTRAPSPKESARNGSPPPSGFTGCHPADAGHERAAPSEAAAGAGVPGEYPSAAEALVPQVANAEVASPVSSVITYGHPASSVIVHSNALAHRSQSSVIAYNGKCAQEKGAGSPSPAASPAASPAKKQPPKDRAQSRERPLGVGANQRHEQQREPRCLKPKKYSTQAKGKTMTYVAKPACAGTASESRGAPLCQITVRIGEEAIVKRRISESDLIRDKGSASKGRRLDGEHQPAAEGKKPRADEADRECQRKTDYFLGNESGDEVSDNDTDDNLWRPYYSYKPKRRAGTFHKTKKSGWRRKLRYRPSARWLQRAAQGADREAEGPMESCSQQQEPSEAGPCDEAKEAGSPVRLGCKFCAATFSDRASAERHERCHDGDQLFTCTTCGKQFSVLRNLRKHEQVHSAAAELHCRHCDKVFTLAKTLKKHEKAHSGQKMWPPPVPPQGPESGGESPGQGPRTAGRKPLERHACVHCTKTCKTAAALGRHQKRHLAEGRKGSSRAGRAPDAERNGGASEPDSAAGNAAGDVRYSEPPCPVPDEVNSNPPKPREGRSGNVFQTEVHQQMIVPYAEHHPQERETCPAGESCSISPRDPMALPAPGGESALGQEMMAPPRAGAQMSSMHQMLMLQGGDAGGADAPETRMPYANASAQEAQAQEMLLPHSRNGSPGTSESSRDPPAPEAVMLPAEDVGEDPAPQGMASARDDGQDFHTLEPMMSQEAVGFEETGAVPESCTESEYPVQEYPIPLITTGNCRSHGEPESKSHAFHPGAVPFKEGHEDLSKVAFYQDPYQLVYGHQLLAGAYPYNFAHVSPLPVALNMVIRDEKGQQLPLLHRMFVYPTPCRDEAPGPLGTNGNGGGGSRDEAGRELLAGEKGSPMY
ncbi:zinc finger and BTB domain-containing protein 38-like [Heptranchias perlo]|uniref:zinc finger and BTB domain-containing protein 38-like n=1 Tax=Heptranchias perlo TaxID=212740 RepID=UPI0035599C14